MKVLITGGGGYTGVPLVEHLLMDGHEVVVIDNFMYGQTPFCHLGPCLFARQLEVINGDACNMRLVEPALRRCDVFIPLAALVGAPLCDSQPMTAHAVNRLAIIAALQYLSPAQRVIYPNTNSGYGIVSPGGYGVLNADGMCLEETPLNPISLYGKLKCDVEAVVLARPNSVVFRLATVFGMSARMRMDLLVNDFVWRAVTNQGVILYEAHFRRNFIHVRDVAAAYIHALDKDVVKDGVYNVGLSDANLTKLQLANTIKGRVPGFEILQAPLAKDPDKRDYLVSNAKFEATGWKPEMSLEMGIDELVQGYTQFKRVPYGNI